MAGNTGGKVPKTPKARALGAALRQERLKRVPGLRTFAEQLGREPSVVSRWETGDRTPKPEDAARFLTVLGVEGERYDEIMALTAGIDDPQWLAVTLPEQRRQLDALVEFEENSTSITSVQPLLIPGLLQTNDYIRAIMSSGAGVPAGEFGVRVAVRIGRREVLTRPVPTQLLALIGEAALRNKIGSPSVMAGQMRQLEEMSLLANVRLLVVPHDAGWNPSLEGSFILVKFEQSPPIVHVELRDNGLFVHEDPDAGRYQKAVDDVLAVALDQQESLEMIDKYRDRWETQSDD
jgi:transcriptional regulator with XRE-family HTH domain